MLQLTSERRGPLSHLSGDGWGSHHHLVHRDRDRGGPTVGWLVAGVVVVGLGALAWTYLGPDLRRYLKLHSM
ncbi:MAG TPA: hypothetical protein VG406_21700 [Isosphaeraceae bacterium]|jgi:hypothetical protein|nr:hypothetical protein [Isosphaeraceae bacterium]